MTIVAEPTVAETWIQEQLMADPADLRNAVSSRIYAYAAPQAAGGAPTYPFIVHQRQGSSDFNLLGSSRLWADMLYLVRVVGRVTSWDTLKPIAAMVDERLHDKRGDPSDGGHVLQCVRVEAYTLVEVLSGVQYRHLGGIYRLLVQGD